MSRLLFRGRLLLSLALVCVTGLTSAPARPSGELADPTRPPAAATSTVAPRADASDGSRELRAIFVSDGRRLALIGDRRVREGDSLGAARVVRIASDRVVLRREGELEELRMLPRRVKRQRRSRTPTTEPAEPDAAEKQEDPR